MRPVPLHGGVRTHAETAKGGGGEPQRNFEYQLSERSCIPVSPLHVGELGGITMNAAHSMGNTVDDSARLRRRALVRRLFAFSFCTHIDMRRRHPRVSRINSKSVSA